MNKFFKIVNKKYPNKMKKLAKLKQKSENQQRTFVMHVDVILQEKKSTSSFHYQQSLKSHTKVTEEILEQKKRNCMFCNSKKMNIISQKSHHYFQNKKMKKSTKKELENMLDNFLIERNEFSQAKQSQQKLNSFQDQLQFEFRNYLINLKKQNYFFPSNKCRFF